MDKKAIVIQMGGFFVLIVLAIAAIWAWNSFIQPSQAQVPQPAAAGISTVVGSATAVTVDGKCQLEGFVPINGVCTCVGTEDTTVTVASDDKFDNSVSIGGNHYYKIDGGSRLTLADAGSFTASPGNRIDLLANYGNSTAYNIIRTEFIKCKGTQTISIQDSIRNSTSMSIKCFDENNDRITDTGTNLTLGTGQARTFRCDLEGTIKRGMPHGGVLVIELNGTTYKENDLDVSGFINQKTSVPGAYGISTTDNKAKAWIVPPSEGTTVRTFHVTVSPEDTKDPSASGENSATAFAKDDLRIRLYDNQAFEEEDLPGSPFVIGVEDLDNSFQGMIRGQAVEEIVHVD